MVSHTSPSSVMILWAYHQLRKHYEMEIILHQDSVVVDDDDNDDDVTPQSAMISRTSP